MARVFGVERWSGPSAFNEILVEGVLCRGVLHKGDLHELDHRGRSWANVSPRGGGGHVAHVHAGTFSAVLFAAVEGAQQFCHRAPAAGCASAERKASRPLRKFTRL